MNKEKIINLLKEIENELNIKEKIELIKLEPKNFKINSDGWTKKTDENGVEYLENETADVWQLLSNGEQLFTWEAAMRETKKAGKRMPTDEEFEKFEKKDFEDVVYTGYRNTNGYFHDLGRSANFWSSIESGSSAWYRDLISSYSTVNRGTCDKDNGFSVRCFKE